MKKISKLELKNEKYGKNAKILKILNYLKLPLEISPSKF